MFKKRAVFKRSVRRFETSLPAKRFQDHLIAEEPFTLNWQASDGVLDHLASTMRTPGQDFELAAGMLFAESVIRKRAELKILSFCSGGGVNELNKLKAELAIDSKEVERRRQHRPSSSLPQSACGMCSLENLESPGALLEWAQSRYEAEARECPPEELRRALNFFDTDCPLFAKTGASHATIVVGPKASLLSVGEDVGRHNACDKAIGSLLMKSDANGEKPFALPSSSGIVFSSRLSFELASKAVLAGVSWMASLGAPSHLSVELAATCGIPLYGFVSQEKFNRYC